MKYATLLTGSALVAVMTGCITYPSSEERRVQNTWLVNTLSDSAMDNAIIAQQALFPYHFVANAATLNDLGKRDLAVLAAHYGEYPGELSIRRGSTGSELYEARVQAIVESLAQAGVETDRIAISDGLPGGEGMPSEEVLKILGQRGAQSSLGSSMRTGGVQMTGTRP